MMVSPTLDTFSTNETKWWYTQLYRYDNIINCSKNDRPIETVDYIELSSRYIIVRINY